MNTMGKVDLLNFIRRKAEA